MATVFIAENGEIYSYSVVGVNKTKLKLVPVSVRPFARPSLPRIVDVSIPMQLEQASRSLTRLLNQRIESDQARLSQLL